MRLFHVLPILSLLFGARASSLDSRHPDAHPLDARDVSDVCATLNPSPDDPDLFGPLAISDAIGQFDLSLSQPISRVLSLIIMLTGSCLCVSQVAQFVDDEFFFFSVDPTTLTNYVRRKFTVPLGLPDRVLI